MERAVWCKANGRVTPVTPKNGTDFSLEELQKFVGGFIEVVRLNDDQIMVVNEEGAIKDMEYNPAASAIMIINPETPSEPIFGDVLVCDTDLVK